MGERIEEVFKQEVAKIQRVVGARGMEYLWNGQRFPDLATAKDAVALHVHNLFATDTTLRSPTMSPGANKSPYDFLFAISGALLLGAVAIGLEALLVILFEGISGSRITPRGLGWIAMPITAMIAGFRLGPSVSVIISKKTADAIKVDEVRLLLAGSAFWTIAVLLFVLMFEPFGYYMRDWDYWTMAKVISFPIFLGVFALLGIAWLRRQPR